MKQSKQNSASNLNKDKKIALQFIILMGFVSLFGDITYEGARSISGPYLAMLGASASIVGLVAGLGELIGYTLRLISGYFADRTKEYWPITIAGYGLLCAIPLIALTDHWEVAALLIIMERIGKGIRTPARDAILSHTTKQVGRGFGFGLHEALDQIGAIIGPLIFSAVFFLKGGYRRGFTILWIPAVLCIVTLLLARNKVPSPVALETSRKTDGQKKADGRNKLSRTFWFYALFTFFSVTGFVNFQIISYHFKIQSVVSETQIPIFYAIAMGMDALVALVIGKTYDKVGLTTLITIPLLTLPIPFLAFSISYNMAIITALLWGAVMGVHETIMRAAIADLVSIEHRGFAYGVFNTIYGVAWFAGSTIMGFVYDFSILDIIAFTVIMELISLIAFFLLRKEILLSWNNA